MYITLMVQNLIRTIEMMGENRYCINRAKDKTIFTKDNKEYYIYWVKDYSIKLIDIKTDIETDWINIRDFIFRYKETEYCLK